MKLTDIAPIEIWAEMEKEAWEKFGIQSAVLDVNGIRITETKNWSNPVCPEIKGTDKGQTFICATAHMNMAGQAKKTGRPVIEECDAGFTKIVVPIFVENEFVGVAGGCGLLATNGEVDAFAVNKIAEIDANKIADLSEGISTRTPPEQIESATAFFIRKVDELTAPS